MSVFSVIDTDQRNDWRGGYNSCLSLVAKAALGLVQQHRSWLEQGQVGDEKLITVTEDERYYCWYRVRLSAEHYDSLFRCWKPSFLSSVSITSWQSFILCLLSTTSGRR